MLETLNLCLEIDESRSEAAIKAVRFATMCAANLGASVFEGNHPQPNNEELTIIIRACNTPSPEKSFEGISEIQLILEDWQDEATLFAQSGLAALLGDPNREPLVPDANFAAHTIGYAAFGAITALHAKWVNHGAFDSATVYGLPALTWVNWKAVAGGKMGRPMYRAGEKAEWPIMPCKDGFTAFLFTERDWDTVKKLIGDPLLEERRFASFTGRAEHRDEYIPILKAWCMKYTQAELNAIFLESKVPGAALLTVDGLNNDPLLKHRNTISTNGNVQPPHRIARSEPSIAPNPGFFVKSTSKLPLAGIRVLDLGIITAGAGVGAMLADMGAEVLKIESETYPDPFRSWAGAIDGDSPLFKFNNRNKYGLAIDLKTETGKAQFLKLVESSDLVLENFRRGVLDRLGMTFDVLRQHNDRILLASISSQGLEGPGALHTTFGSTLEANSGFSWMTQYEDGLPYISGRQLNFPDQTIALYATAIISAALMDCKTSGKARHVDISQRDATVYQLFDRISEVHEGKADLRPYAARQQIFTAKDGSNIALSGNVIAALLSHIGGHDRNALNAWAADQSVNDIQTLCAELGGAAVLSVKGQDLLKIANSDHTEVFAESPDGTFVKGFPFQLSKTPMTIWANSPKVGEHTSKFI